MTAIAPTAQAGGKHKRSGGYIHESELPFPSLLFVAPLVIIYEAGTRYFTTAAQHGYNQQIIAFTLMQRFFRLMGVHGQHLPALALAAVLIAWQVARRERWRVHFSTLAGMLAESILLALPLILLSRAVSRYVPLSTACASRTDLVVLSLGAGVYEEFAFRLVLFSALSVILKNGMGVRSVHVILPVVLISALAFSGYHYLSPVEHFQWRSFAFRTLAGVYFGVLFLLRGFGITAVSHAAYDILVLFL